MEKKGTREYTLWSLGMFVILFFALMPVLWIVSLSLNTPMGEVIDHVPSSPIISCPSITTI